MAKKKGLTPKQQKFVDVYAGNGTEAARLAGYKGAAHTLANVARNLLRKTEIVAAIQKRQEIENRRLIATRQQRQEFWTKVMLDENKEMSARLKASELLGRSEADFTDKVQQTPQGETHDDWVLRKARERGILPPGPERPQ